MHYGVVDLANPINIAHPLMKVGLVSRYKRLPYQTRGTMFRELRGRNHGTLTGGAAWSGSRAGQGRYGAVEYVDSDARVDVGTDVFNRALEGASGITVGFWCYVLSRTASQYDNVLFLSYKNTTGGVGLTVFTPGAVHTDKITYNDVSDSSDGFSSDPSTSTVPLNTWTFVCCSSDYAADKKYIYLNGVLDATITASFAFSTRQAITSNAQSCLGGDGAAFGTSSARAICDDYLLYKRRLSDSEIWALYQATRSPFDPTLNWIAGGPMMDTGAAPTVSVGRGVLYGSCLDPLSLVG